MKYLILSDIHANLTALQEVLNTAKDFDAVWCLGDLVGYGPDPNECIEIIQNLPNLSCILGNHDAAALNQINPETFNHEARVSIQWTKKTLSKSSSAFLQSLPETIEIESVTLAHGSPRRPVWEYLLDIQSAADNFKYFNTPFCFVGHTHLPAIYTFNKVEESTRLRIPFSKEIVTLHPRSIANPGSVGQPRDRDPRASFAIFESGSNTWNYQRVKYNIPEIQSRMASHNLPERHRLRLASGW
jgi:diadenosine tetraphosphatase ApaH/serine/threonine PP2A family protein phosphatase